MTMTGNIFLVGPPACGKTTLGEHLAARLGLEFCDSDKAIEERTGLSVAEIFEREGEARFREHETAAILELTQKKSIVLATGGGAVLSEQNRRCLRTHGTVVYLKVSVETQLARTTGDRSRPLLTGSDPRAALEQITRTRETFYTQIADITLNVDNKPLNDIGDMLVNELSRLKPEA